LLRKGLSARRAFFIFEELPAFAAFVGTQDHQALAAAFACILDERFLHAFGADDVKRSPAALTDGVSLADLMETVRAAVYEGTHAAAFGAEVGISGDEIAAMDAWLFIECHDITSLSPIIIF
jgi:hypothetical protein